MADFAQDPHQWWGMLGCSDNILGKMGPMFRLGGQAHWSGLVRAVDQIRSQLHSIR